MNFFKKIAPQKLIQTIGIIAITANFAAHADETISFKGIKFGMSAAEIAKLGGGDTKYGCASAIKSYSALDKSPQSWTYGGINAWMARCNESMSEDAQVPNTSGLFELNALVSKHGRSFAKDTYSVDELVEVFSKVFGRFQVETKIVKNGLGQEFEKKIAIATSNGAAIKIMDTLTGANHQDYIEIEITSLDYLAKKANWEKQKSNKKLNDSKADF